MKKLILVAALFTTSAYAEFWDGNKLLNHIKAESLYRQGMALGYIMGVHDTMQEINHCPPPNAQAGQMLDMVENYLNNVPAQRHKAADVLVLHVLKTAFPCANNNRRGGTNL